MNSNSLSFAQGQLEEIKLHAIQNCEFYKNYRLGDVFPVVNKMIILQNQKSMLARDGFQQPLHKISTSGSTGIPFTVTQDYKKRMRTIADLQVFGERSECPVRERLIFFRVACAFKRTSEQEDRENIYYIDATYMDDNHIAEMVDEINSKCPHTISGYASTMIAIARYIERLGLKLDNPNLTSVRVGGERCEQSDCKFLEEIFQVPVYRRYSDNELGILGQDMAYCSAYELNWGSFYFEVLDLDKDVMAKQGEPGRIVVTDLFNYAQPIIRYDTGDIGIMECPDNALPRLKEVWGRRADCVYSTNDELISSHAIDGSMWGVKGLDQWQFIQEKRNQYILKVKLNGKPDFDLIIFKLKEILGEDANIQIQCVEDIPQITSRKRRLIICNYKH